MKEAYIINGVRTAVGNFGGSLSPVRADDLAAIVIKKLPLVEDLTLRQAQGDSLFEI